MFGLLLSVMTLTFPPHGCDAFCTASCPAPQEYACCGVDNWGCARCLCLELNDPQPIWQCKKTGSETCTITHHE